MQEVKLALNAIAELNPDTLCVAASQDAERKNGTIRGLVSVA